MSRFRARVDDNHREVVKALRRIPGVTVHSTAPMGKGFPDLLIGYQGRNLLLEVKDGSKPPSARKLTEDEETWHAGWAGQVAVVESPEEAVLLVLRGVGRRVRDLDGTPSVSRQLTEKERSLVATWERDRASREAGQK